MDACCGPRSSAPTRTSSDKLSYWPAGTRSHLQNNHTPVFVLSFFSFNPVKHKLELYRWNPEHDSTKRRRCQWVDTYNNISQHPVVSPRLSLTHKHTSTDSYLSKNQSDQTQIQMILIAYFLCVPPGSYKIVVLSSWLRKQHILYVSQSTATT